MKNSSARQGALHFSLEEHQKIAFLKKTAENQVCWDGTAPLDCHRATLCGIEIAFFLNVDREEGYGQYQLHLSRRMGQLELDEVQAMAATFFGQKEYQIMPDERNPMRIRVTGLFFSYPTE